MDGVWIKRAAMAATAIIVVAGFAWALREKPALVDVATVVETPMHVAVREEGVTRVRDIYTVSAPIAGHLTRTVLEEGDSVVLYCCKMIDRSIRRCSTAAPRRNCSRRAMPRVRASELPRSS